MKNVVKHLSNNCQTFVNHVSDVVKPLSNRFQTCWGRCQTFPSTRCVGNPIALCARGRPAPCDHNRTSTPPTSDGPWQLTMPTCKWDGGRQLVRNRLWRGRGFAAPARRPRYEVARLSLGRPWAQHIRRQTIRRQTKPTDLSFGGGPWAPWSPMGPHGGP